MFDVKICGLSTTDNIDAAIGAGANMIGLVFFAKSPRHLSFEKAAELSTYTRQVYGNKTTIIALTVDAGDAYLADIICHAKPDILQLHGSETVGRCQEITERFGISLMKVIGVSEASDLLKISDYVSVTDRILLDAKAPPENPVPGGNGLTFNWDLLDGLKDLNELPNSIMLAGGLRPDNIGEAIEVISANKNINGVDISTGVESRPGIKDNNLIKQFLNNTQHALLDNIQSQTP